MQNNYYILKNVFLSKFWFDIFMLRHANIYTYIFFNILIFYFGILTWSCIFSWLISIRIVITFICFVDRLASCCSCYCNSEQHNMLLCFAVAIMLLLSLGLILLTPRLWLYSFSLPFKLVSQTFFNLIKLPLWYAYYYFLAFLFLLYSFVL